MLLDRFFMELLQWWKTLRYPHNPNCTPNGQLKPRPLAVKSRWCQRSQSNRGWSMRPPIRKSFWTFHKISTTKRYQKADFTIRWYIIYNIQYTYNLIHIRWYLTALRNLGSLPRVYARLYEWNEMKQTHGHTDCITGLPSKTSKTANNLIEACVALCCLNLRQTLGLHPQDPGIWMLVRCAASDQ